MKKSARRMSCATLKIAAGILFMGILIGYARGDPSAGLDVKLRPPKYFIVDNITAGSTGSLETSWSLTLRRNGAAASYGAYTITYNEQGYDPANSTIENFPDINPRYVPTPEVPAPSGDQGGGNNAGGNNDNPNAGAGNNNAGGNSGNNNAGGKKK